MLRNDGQVALNEVIVACKDLAERYRDAGEMVQETALAGVFAKLVGERQLMADALTTPIRRLGELPDASDPDRETVESVMTRIKAVLSADERLVLLEQCQQAERRILERTQAALEQDLPRDTLAVLGQLQRDVTGALERLAREKARI